MPILITQGNRVIAHTKDRATAVRFLKHKHPAAEISVYRPRKDEYEVYAIAQVGDIVTRFILYRTRKWYDKSPKKRIKKQEVGNEADSQ